MPYFAAFIALLSLLAAGAPGAFADPNPTFTATPIAGANSLELDRRDLERPPRAALFWADGFPTADAEPIPGSVLETAIEGLPVDRLGSVDALRRELRLRTYDILILPYGSSFPLEAWTEIRFFLKGGGGLVALGGAPFHQPVRQTESGFVSGVRQPTFADDLKIGPYDVWRRSEENGASRVRVAEGSGWTHAFAEPDRVFELTVRLGNRPDSPADHGSEAYRDAILRPLVHVVDAGGLPRACPLLEIDKLRGPAAGARWVMAPTDAPLSSETIRGMIERAFEGPSQLTVRPIYATVEPHETPRVRVMQRRPRGRPGESVPAAASVRVWPAGQPDRAVFEGEVAHEGESDARYGTLELSSEAAWGPGLY
ncbi:MAG: hypothetical protein AAF725_06450, partial [Acidobacteriota bacterium]